MIDLRAVAAHRLPADFPEVVSALDEATWRRLLDKTRSQRLDALLAAFVADGRLPLTEAQADELALREVQAAARVLRLEHALLEVDVLLRQAQVPYRVLKGAAHARLDYSEPDLRQFGDVDLLVHPEHIDRALGLLVDGGCTRPVPELVPGFDRRFGKGVTLVRPDGVELDIHRTLVAGVFGVRTDLEELHRSECQFEVGGRPLPALSHSARFLHACYHAALGDPTPRMLALRDIAEMMLRHDFDWDDALRTARSWGGEAVVARAVLLCVERLNVFLDPVASTWARGRVPSRLERRAIESCLRTDGRFASQALGALVAIPGVRPKLAYANALARPQQSHLESRSRSWLGHVRRGARRLWEVARSR